MSIILFTEWQTVFTLIQYVMNSDVTSDIERNTVTVSDSGNKTLTVLNSVTGNVRERRSVKD